MEYKPKNLVIREEQLRSFISACIRSVTEIKIKKSITTFFDAFKKSGIKPKLRQAN